MLTNTGDPCGTEAQFAERRAAEQAAADIWADQFAMRTLDGPERAVAWASRCRHHLVTAAHTLLVVEGELDNTDWADIEDAAHTLTRAGWRLDRRDADPADLPELLTAATSADRPTESPC